jgi:hypothetical protein
VAERTAHREAEVECRHLHPRALVHVCAFAPRPQTQCGGFLRDIAQASAGVVPLNVTPRVGPFLDLFLDL